MREENHTMSTTGLTMVGIKEAASLQSLSTSLTMRWSASRMPAMLDARYRLLPEKYWGKLRKRWLVERAVLLILIIS